jgi:hypothetical protein
MQPAPRHVRHIDSRLVEAGVRSWVAAVAAAVLLAGCGSALARPGSGPDRRAAGGPGGSRAEAMTLARHLLAQLELGLPAGARPAQVRSLPPLLRDRRAPGAGWVSAQRILLAPGKPRAVWETLLARLHGRRGHRERQTATLALGHQRRPRINGPQATRPSLR